MNAMVRRDVLEPLLDDAKNLSESIGP